MNTDTLIVPFQTSLFAVLALVAAIVGFFLVVKLVKWIRAGNVSESLDQRITRRGQQYGRYASGPWGHESDSSALRREYRRR